MQLLRLLKMLAKASEIRLTRVYEDELGGVMWSIGVSSKGTYYYAYGKHMPRVLYRFMKHLSRIALEKGDNRGRSKSSL